MFLLLIRTMCAVSVESYGSKSFRTNWLIIDFIAFKIIAKKIDVHFIQCAINMYIFIIVWSSCL